MKKHDQKEIYANVMERLIKHLQDRNDVQNIDLMNLAGFCRNCLSKWYLEEAEKKNINLSYKEVRELIYGMSYDEWKKKFQKEATQEQIDKRKGIKN